MVSRGVVERRCPRGRREWARWGGAGADPVFAVAEGRAGAGLGVPGAARQLFPALTPRAREALGTASGVRVLESLRKPRAATVPPQAQDAARTDRGRAVAAGVSAQSR